MTVLKRPVLTMISLLVIGFFIGSTGLAVVGEQITLNGDLFARSSADFASKLNIQSVVPSGSMATVLEMKTMPSGSIGVRVKLTSILGSRGSDTAKVGEEAWIYHSKSNPWFNMNGEPEVDSASGIATTKVPGVPDSEDPNLARNTDRTQTEGSYCANCVANRAPPSTKKNQKEIAAVTHYSGKVTAPKAPNPTPIIPRYIGSDPWGQFPEVRNYENSSITNRMIKSAKSNAEPRSTKYCYRYVKNAMLESKMIASRPDGNADVAVKGMQAKGMYNMLDDPRYKAIIAGDPRKAPKGAIIIYGNQGSKPPHWGDTQIKTESGRGGQFVSDFISSNTYLTSPKATRAKASGIPYTVVGVMIRKDL